MPVYTKKALPPLISGLKGLPRLLFNLIIGSSNTGFGFPGIPGHTIPASDQQTH